MLGVAARKVAHLEEFGLGARAALVLADFDVDGVGVEVFVRGVVLLGAVLEDVVVETGFCSATVHLTLVDGVAGHGHGGDGDFGLDGGVRERVFIEGVEEPVQLMPLPPYFCESERVDDEGEEDGHPDNPVESGDAEEVPSGRDPAPQQRRAVDTATGFSVHKEVDQGGDE